MPIPTDKICLILLAPSSSKNNCQMLLVV